MPFDSICLFIVAKTFGFNTSVASVLDSLGVNHNQRCPFWFFGDGDPISGSQVCDML
jgi:hypothetical protein